MKTLLKSAAVATVLVGALAGSAHASVVVVDSALNSTGGGTGKATGLFLTAGQQFTVTSDVLDTWSLGSNDPCTRESNANGLTACYGNYSQGGLTALYGSMVGSIGSATGGPFFFLGTNFSGIANATGQLFLFNFDSNTGDNSGSITANVSAVPVPGALALLASGLLGIGALGRKLRKA